MATVQFQYMQVTSTARLPLRPHYLRKKGVTYAQEPRPYLPSLKAALLSLLHPFRLMNPT